MEHGPNSQQLWDMAQDRRSDLLREASQLALLKQSRPVAQPQTNQGSTLVSTFLWQSKLLWRQILATRNSSYSG